MKTPKKHREARMIAEKRLFQQMFKLQQSLDEHQKEYQSYQQNDEVKAVVCALELLMEKWLYSS